MKTLVTILAAVALAAIWLPASAEILTDEQLEQIYAGNGVELFATADVNSVDSGRSAVAAQGNVGATISSGGQSDIQCTNSNDAGVYNTGNSAVALQSNIGAAVSYETETGDLTGVTITNKNDADVDNAYTGIGNGVGGSSVDVGVAPYCGVTINDVSVDNSAVAAQSNIGAAVACGGSVGSTTIKNTNHASVYNYPAQLP